MALFAILAATASFFVAAVKAAMKDRQAERKALAALHKANGGGALDRLRKQATLKALKAPKASA